MPQALAGYRPQVVASLGAGLQAVRNLLPDNTIQGATLHPWTIGVTVTQVLFNGFKTANSVRVAEFQVQSGREALRNVGQGVLLDAVTAYMNVIANEALLQAQQTNVACLREILGTTRKRLDAGDVTPTDLAQAEARLSRGLADLNAADVALAISKATYTQVIGDAAVAFARGLAGRSALARRRCGGNRSRGQGASGGRRRRFRCRCRSNHDQGRGEQPAADRYRAGQCQPLQGFGPDTQHLRHRSGLDPRADQCADL